MNFKPKVISTFAGCGGSSLGYHLAGYEELLAIEWEDDAASTFKMNFPNIPVWQRDISKVTSDEILSFCGLDVGELDVFDGSPPCQGFSITGKRKVSDDRNDLFRDYAHLIDGLKPKVFIMENVSGMTKGNMKGKFNIVLRHLKSLGYSVKCKLVNSMFYGVPQNRDRLIFIGIRNDLGISPSFPPHNSEPISFYSACHDLRGNDDDDRILPEIIKKYAAIHPGGWNTDFNIYKSIKGNCASAISLKWLDWSRVCGTIVKSEISVSGIVHPDKERYISLAEAKRIGSFPDDFKFTNRKKGIERIGNSVPPLLMKAIAGHVKNNILTKISHQ